MNENIAELTNLVRNLLSLSASIDPSMNKTQSSSCNSVYIKEEFDSSVKKRKVIEDESMKSLGFPNGVVLAPGKSDVPVIPMYRSNSTESQRFLRNNLKDADLSFDGMDIWGENEAEFIDVLLTPGETHEIGDDENDKASVVSSLSSPMLSSIGSIPTRKDSTERSISPVRMEENSVGEMIQESIETTNSQDILKLLPTLPPALQERFVDQLAEKYARHSLAFSYDQASGTTNIVPLVNGKSSNGSSDFLGISERDKMSFSSVQTQRAVACH